MGKGGGGQPTQTTSTSYNTNIPEYAQPYVETMLGATQKQLFQGNTDESGNYNITGFKPYQAYGGTYDAQGNQTSYDPSKAIAGFSPLQQQAQAGTAGLQVPGQFGAATDITGAGIMGAMGTAGQAQRLNRMGADAAQAGNQYAMQATNPYAMGAYMSPYMQNVVGIQQREAQRASDIQGQQNQAQAVGAGAYGGSRQALVEAERQRNLATQKGDIEAQGLQSAYQQAQQAQQYAANLGLQGQQAGAGMIGQGIGAQQAAFNQALQGAGQLGALGGQQLAAQQSILGAQNQAGAQQQAYQQQVINQAMTDYANAQQYPLMQLGTMSNMLRGLPMQAQTTSQYAAAPNAITQGIGAAGAVGSLMSANKAEGGVIKGYASGGITSIPSYEVGGAIKADLEDMDVAGLQREIKESSSPRVKQMAQEILATKKMAQAPGHAGGGIIAFAEPTKENNQSLVKDKEYEDTDVSFKSTVPSTKTPLTRAGQAIRDAFATKTPEKMRFEELDSELLPKKEAVVADKGITAVPVPKERAAPISVAAEEKANPAGGILGNASAGVLGQTPKVNPADWYGQAMSERNKFLDTAQQDPIALAKKLEEQAGPNAGREEYRASMMAERANLKDEAERQRHLRLAEFFASWGSTPGPTLVAGMAALKKAIPGMVDDRKEAKKLQRESDKIIYDIDEATRLDKAGYRKEAQVLIQQAATNAAHLNTALGSYASHDLTAKASMANASAQREATAASKAAAGEERKINSLIHAQGNITNLLKAHEGERKDSQYTNAASMVKVGKDENGIDKPLDKIPKELRGQIAEARKVVSTYDARHREELRDARAQERALRDRTSIGDTKKKEDTTDNDPFKIRP